MSRKMTFRAFKIADEAMFEMLKAHCVAGDETQFGLVDDGQQEVRSLAEASDPIQEAVEWLKTRGFVAVESDANGEFISVLKRPGECELCDGSGEYFAHDESCRDDLCALNGDIHSCGGKVVPCECAALPGEGAEHAEVEQLVEEALRLNELYATNLLMPANRQACIARDALKAVLEQLASRCRSARRLEALLRERVGEVAADDIKAVVEALALGPTPGPHHIYTHPRDDNNFKANERWVAACEPERIERLLRLVLPKPTGVPA